MHSMKKTKLKKKNGNKVTSYHHITLGRDTQVGTPRAHAWDFKYNFNFNLNHRMFLVKGEGKAIPNTPR